MKGFLYFSADWCQPCKTLGPIMDQVAKQVTVNKINIDLNIYKVSISDKTKKIYEVLFYNELK